jgi:hypothetical protein
MNSKGRRILLYGASGSRCGHLDLDILFDIPDDQRVELIVLSQSYPPFEAKGKSIELSDQSRHPVVSTTSNPYSVLEPELDCDLRDGIEVSVSSGAKPTVDKNVTYNVMLILWTGQFYERRAVGSISEPHIIDCYPSGPQWKEITLG